MGIFSFFDAEVETEAEQEQERDTSTATTETTTQTKNTTEELNKLLQTQQTGEQTESQIGSTLTSLLSDTDLSNLRGLTDLLSGSVGESNLLPAAGAGATLESIDIASLIGDQAADIPSLIQSLIDTSATTARSEFDLVQQAQLTKVGENLGGKFSNSAFIQLQGDAQRRLEETLARQAVEFGIQGKQLGLQFAVAGAETLRGGAQTATDVRGGGVNNLLQSLGILKGSEATQATDLKSLIESLTTGKETTKQTSEQDVLAELLRNLVSTSKETASGTSLTTQTTSDPIGQLSTLLTSIGSLGAGFKND